MILFGALSGIALLVFALVEGDPEPRHDPVPTTDEVRLLPPPCCFCGFLQASLCLFAHRLKMALPVLEQEAPARKPPTADKNCSPLSPQLGLSPSTRTRSRSEGAAPTDRTPLRGTSSHEESLESSSDGGSTSAASGEMGSEANPLVENRKY